MNWLWLNVPLMAVFFLAMSGIPVWLVVKHPDTGPADAADTVQLRAARPAAPAAVRDARSRELVGASR